VERETGILTEVFDSYDWITFLPMADGSGAFNRYFGRLDTGKMKIRGVMARKGDTPEYVSRMQKELFDILAKARSLDELRMIKPRTQEVRAKYMDGLRNVDARELAIHRRVSRMNYSRRCAEASAVQAYQKTWITPGSRDGDRLCGNRCC